MPSWRVPVSVACTKVPSRRAEEKARRMPSDASGIAEPIAVNMPSDEEAALLAREGVVAAPAVLLFDGECNLCNATVDYFIRLDHGSDPPRIKFAPLQSSAAANLLAARGLTPGHFMVSQGRAAHEETVVYVSPSGDVSLRSSAVLLSIALLGPCWLRLPARLCLLVPACARDPFYRCVAGARIRLFGKKDTCRRPTKEDKRHFME